MVYVRGAWTITYAGHHGHDHCAQGRRTWIDRACMHAWGACNPDDLRCTGPPERLCLCFGRCLASETCSRQRVNVIAMQACMHGGEAVQYRVQCTTPHACMVNAVRSLRRMGVLGDAAHFMRPRSAPAVQARGCGKSPMRRICAVIGGCAVERAQRRISAPKEHTRPAFPSATRKRPTDATHVTRPPRAAAVAAVAAGARSPCPGGPLLSPPRAWALVGTEAWVAMAAWAAATGTSSWPWERRRGAAAWKRLSPWGVLEAAGVVGTSWPCRGAGASWRQPVAARAGVARVGWEARVGWQAALPQAGTSSWARERRRGAAAWTRLSPWGVAGSGSRP